MLASSTPVRNDTGGVIKDSYTVSASTTVAGTVSASGTVSGDVGVAQASATVGTSFTLTVNAGFSRTLQMDVPPGQEGYVTLDRVPTDVLVTSYVYTPACERVQDGTALVKGSQTFVTAHTRPL